MIYNIMRSNLAIYIDVFLYDTICINIFRKNLCQFKKLNLPIFIITNKQFPEDLQNEVDHVFYQNADLKFEKKYDSYEELRHYSIRESYKFEKTSIYYQKYGLSVLSNLYKGASTLKILGYDSFIKLEWDFYIGDHDVEVLKNFIDEFKNKNCNGKFILNRNHLIDKQHHKFSVIIWAVKVDYFLLKFPKILDENDYESFLISTFKNRDFKTVERVLYYTLIQNNMNLIDINDEDIFNSQLIDTLGNTHVSKVNYSDLSTDTTEKLFCKFVNVSGQYVFYSNNISYINPTNPNFENIEYIVNTMTRSFTVNHNINNGCWSYNIHTIESNEFPVRVKCGEKEMIYDSAQDVNIEFTVF